MCYILNKPNDGTKNYPYQVDRNYVIMDTYLELEVDAPFCLECYENDSWVRFAPGQNVHIDQGCIFRVTRFTVDFPISPQPLYKRDFVIRSGI